MKVLELVFMYHLLRSKIGCPHEILDVQWFNPHKDGDLQISPGDQTPGLLKTKMVVGLFHTVYGD